MEKGLYYFILAASLADSQLFYSQDFICQPYRGGKEFVSSRRRGRFLEGDFLFFYKSGNRIFFSGVFREFTGIFGISSADF